MAAGMWQWLAEGNAVAWATAAVMLLMSVLSWVVILHKLWFMAAAAPGKALWPSTLYWSHA